MSHFIRVIKRTNGVIVTQDFGDGTPANYYTAENRPDGIDAQVISFEATCSADTVKSVVDLQAQVDVDGEGVQVNLEATPRSDAIATRISNAKTALAGIEASEADAASKPFLQAIRDVLFPDGSADPPA